MTQRVRTHVYLEADDIHQMKRLAVAKGGPRKGYSYSGEVGAAVREYLHRQMVSKEEAVTAPVWQRMLDEKFAQLEAWLRPGVYGGSTYSTTAALILLEMICGKTVSPEQAREYFDLMRGRAWKIIRKEPAPVATAPAKPSSDL